MLGIIVGGIAGTYIRIASDIAAVQNERAPRLRIPPIVGKGSVQNVSGFLNMHDVDVTIVQSDVLSFLRQRRAVPGVEGLITCVAKI